MVGNLSSFFINKLNIFKLLTWLPWLTALWTAIREYPIDKEDKHSLATFIKAFN